MSDRDPTQWMLQVMNHQCAIDYRALSEVLDRVCGSADIVMAESIVEGLGYTDTFHRLDLYPHEAMEA